MTPFVVNKTCNYEWKHNTCGTTATLQISIFTLDAFDPTFGIHGIQVCERLQSTGYILSETTDPYGSFN